ncbi:unnamed protein product [Heterobilharzia americana]|nr:unnamed protein product [Heterobilharzia americana]
MHVGYLSYAVDWCTLTKQYYSDSVYSDIIRPKLQPPFPSSYQTDDASEDPLDEIVRSSLKARTVPDSLNAKESSPMAVNHLLTVSEQSDMHIGVINQLNVDSSSSLDANVPANEEVSPQSINVSLSTSESSPTRNTQQSSASRYTSLLSARKFLPNNLSIGLPSSLSSINLNTVFRYPLGTSIWYNGESLFRSLPDISRMMNSNSSPDPEVRQFLRDLLDYFTHLGNFSPVLDSRLVLSVAAEYDAYVPRYGVCSLTKIYPDAEIRVLPQSGHVGAYVRNAIWTNDFRQAITDCLNRQVYLYHDEPGPFGRTKISQICLRKSHLTKRGLTLSLETFC